MNKIDSCNEIGLSVKKETCRMPDIHFYEESGTVHVWVTVKDMKGESIEALQYLSASDAMHFAKAMENCAIRALKNQS